MSTEVVDPAHLDVCMNEGGCLGGRNEWAERTAVDIYNLPMAGWMAGVLQTPAYRKVVLDLLGVSGPKRAIADSRFERRRAIVFPTDGSEAPTFHTLLDESVLYWNITGPEDMAEQIGLLASAARLDTVSLQIVPFRSRFSPVMCNYSATLPADPSRQPTLLVEPSGDMEPQMLLGHEAFDTFLGARYNPLAAIALSETATLDLLESAHGLYSAWAAGEVAMAPTREEIWTDWADLQTPVAAK